MGLPKKESMTKDYCCCNRYLRSASDLNQYQRQNKRRKVTRDTSERAEKWMNMIWQRWQQLSNITFDIPNSIVSHNLIQLISTTQRVQYYN
ncbi:hypothetical protein MtrunA17_Chr8g0357701 [Medicago truncatula]|uniref:Uncharacterized protein n=1 Tax=Medicago truncatula TaxID=3880 RepID=A0A396GJJ3_MEDTR|nr:hypothetical protein MtrunA17_Chr8g0357701 [Medicago truncatula]